MTPPKPSKRFEKRRQSGPLITGQFERTKYRVGHREKGIFRLIRPRPRTGGSRVIKGHNAVQSRHDSVVHVGCRTVVHGGAPVINVMLAGQGFAGLASPQQNPHPAPPEVNSAKPLPKGQPKTSKTLVRRQSRLRDPHRSRPLRPLGQRPSPWAPPRAPQRRQGIPYLPLFRLRARVWRAPAPARVRRSRGPPRTGPLMPTRPR